MKKDQTLHVAAAAAVEAETKRTLAMLAEARALGIPEEHVDTALSEGKTVDEFVAYYAPVEALAREIAASARAAGL